VALVDYQRAEQKFDSAEALIAQMDEDSTRARATLAGLATGSRTG
ncbi:MAG: riboflavin kinase, partial [Proteobacteria bacterium]|nr:riboflavin kinase [Pseudomonadota bacterium]